MCKKEITDENPAKDSRDVHQECMKKVYAGKEDGVQFQIDDTSICFHCGEEIVCIRIESDMELADPSDDDSEDTPNSVPYNDRYIETWGAYFRHTEKASGTCAEEKTGAYPINSDN